MLRPQPDDAQTSRFELALPNLPAAAVLARRQFMTFIKHLHLNAAFASDMETAVGEALANAVEHGRRPHGTLVVQALLTGDGIDVTVSDDGPGFAPGPAGLDRPAVLAPRGYGIFLIRSVVDRVEFRDDGRTLWFRKHF